MQTSSRLKIILAFATIYIFWGFTYLGLRYSVHAFPPFSVCAWRNIIAGLLLFLLCYRQMGSLPTLKHWIGAFIAGLLFITLGNGTVTYVEVEIPSGIVALIVGAIPIWTALVSFFRNRKALTSRSMVHQLGSVLVGFFGVLILAAPGSSSILNTADPIKFFVLIVGNLAWVFGTVYAKNIPSYPNRLISTGMSMLAGGLLAFVPAFFLGEFADWNFQRVDALAMVSFWGLVIFGSVIAFSCYTYLLSVCDPTVVSTYAYINPLIALVAGWYFANEPLNNRTILAAALIIGSVIFLSLPRIYRSLQIYRRSAK